MRLALSDPPTEKLHLARPGDTLVVFYGLVLPISEGLAALSCILRSSSILTCGTLEKAYACCVVVMLESGQWAYGRPSLSLQQVTF
eukprot:scaffold5443_cov291-Pinguiococcus_pyrenoidosus.AAC.11